MDPNLALGTSSGLLLVYSISKADLEYSISSGTSQSICCLSSTDNTTLYSGEEQNILEWNLDKRKLKRWALASKVEIIYVIPSIISPCVTFFSKWKSGNEKITSILALPLGNQILTASKTIKLWDVETKEVLKTYTGHSSEVIFLHYIIPNGREDGYFISGSKVIVFIIQPLEVMSLIYHYRGTGYWIVGNLLLTIPRKMLLPVFLWKTLCRQFLSIVAMMDLQIWLLLSEVG